VTAVERADAALELATLAFPGRWMPDAQLERLQGELHTLTRECLGDVPAYGIYQASREPYRDRIITTVRMAHDRRLVAFSAMILWHTRLPDGGRPQPVMHLGLVLVAPGHRGRKVMYALYHKPLLWFFLRRLLRPFWLTSTTMEPVIVGSVADSFSQVHPHYVPRPGFAPSPAHRHIARTFFRKHGHEIGVWEGALLDEERFVIRGSSLGACRTLMLPFEQAAMYRVAACNEFCRTTLDYSRGDELLQVGRVDVAALGRSSWWMLRKAKRKLSALGAPLRRDEPAG
jgi:hypothetical protein